MKKQNLLSQQSGFTLIEILTAIGISTITMLLAASALVSVSNLSQRIATDNEFEKVRGELNNLFGFRGYCNANMTQTFPMWTYVENLAKNTTFPSADLNNIEFKALTDDLKQNFTKKLSPSGNINLVKVEANFALSRSTASNIIADIQFVFEQKIAGTNDKKDASQTTIAVPFIFKNFDSANQAIRSCYTQASNLEESTRELCSTYGGSLINGECRMPRFARDVQAFTISPNRARASAFSVDPNKQQTTPDTMSFGDTLCYLDNLTIRAMFKMDGNSFDTYQANRRTLYCKYPSSVKSTDIITDDTIKTISPKVSKNVRQYFPEFGFNGSVEVLNANHKK